MPPPWTASILTLYPEMFPGPLGHSLTGRALEDGLWRLETTQLRDFAKDRHRSVDDTPAGGGAGMVLRADVLGLALDAVAKPDRPTIFLTPSGAPFDQAMARRFADGPGLTLVCGRFEGFDARIFEARDVEQISLGDFVMTGGEIAAQALIDACVRLIPRVLGNSESSVEESFSSGLLEYPQYTRPTEWEGLRIPDVLLSGHHGHIAEWRSSQAERLTKERRPDLWRAFEAQASRRHPAGEAELSDAQTTADKGGTVKDGTT